MMIEWVMNNQTLAAGIITVVAMVVIGVFQHSGSNKTTDAGIHNTNNTTVIVSANADPKMEGSGAANNRGSSRILFVDDDTTFQVVKILKRAGWLNAKAVKDIDSLDSAVVRDTDIFFIDIQGVGKALKFKDEGLGLALALKGRYPEKKVVIYSAEPMGDRFHQAFRVADDFLSKTAEPYEFQQVIENLLSGNKGGQ